MSQLDLIKNRRSIRKFIERDLPDDLLTQILEAARWAPSWGNSQCWEIIVIKEFETRQKLQQIVSARNPATLAMRQAPVLLALCGERERAGYYKGTASTRFGDWLLYDLGLVSQNIALTASSLGLGTVVIGAFDHDQAKRILQIPDPFEIVALMPIGFPAQNPVAPGRKEVSAFTHYETFGRQEYR